MNTGDEVLISRGYGVDSGYQKGVVQAVTKTQFSVKDSGGKIRRYMIRSGAEVGGGPYSHSYAKLWNAELHQPLLDRAEASTIRGWIQRAYLGSVSLAALRTVQGILKSEMKS